MKTRDALALGFIAVAVVAACGLLLCSQEEELAYSVPWTGGADADDPFADMIEEGAGLIAQLKAEAAERAGR